MTVRILALSLALCCSSAAALGQDLNKLIDTVFATHQFKEVTISSDGSQVAWVEQWPLDDMRYQSHVFIAAVSAEGIGIATPVVAGNAQDEHGITWSPDGRRLAFLADETNQGKPSLHIFDLQTQQVRMIAAPIGELSLPRWSPDGSNIAVLAKPADPATAIAPGDWIHRDTVPTRLVLINPATGKLQSIGSPELSVYEYDWSPDSQHIAITAASGDANDNWWHARLYRIDLDSDHAGKAVELFTPPLQIAAPVWSPDSKQIAFIGGLMSDFIAPGGEVYVVSAEGGKATNITPSLAGSATGLHWRRANEVIFSEDIDGETSVAVAAPNGGPVITLWRAEDNISTGGLVSGLSTSKDGRNSAVIKQSFTQAPEVWAGTTGQWKQVTNRNASLIPGWGQAKSVHWQNGGQKLQGWLLYPRDYNPGRKYPMIVDVHGGPAGDSASKWPLPFYNMQVLAGKGYFIFYPNARGSLGEGEAFTQANVKDIGYGDLKDITTGVEHLTSTLPIDAHRVGITGWSYGGYMAMWAGTQTNIFKASVAGPGTSNWQSYYGQVDIENWLLPYFGKPVYEDPAIYARSSPINFIDKDKTPTMMYAGSIDPVCPTPQSYELYRALEHMGVPTSLVIYPGETHGLAIPKYQRAVTIAAADWFAKYMP